MSDDKRDIVDDGMTDEEYDAACASLSEGSEEVTTNAVFGAADVEPVGVDTEAFSVRTASEPQVAQSEEGAPVDEKSAADESAAASTVATAVVSGESSVSTSDSVNSNQPVVVDTDKAKTSYKPGEKIDLSGVVVSQGGRNVTSEATIAIENDLTVFPADAKSVLVTVTHAGMSTTFEIQRKRSILPLLLLVLAIIGILIGVYLAFRPQEPKFPEGDTGSYLIPKGDMSDEDAQKLVDEMAEKSRITVSLAPEMRLASDGRLRVNLVVPEGNNGLSERLEIEQDGKVVYRSGIVAPGNRLEWGNNTEGAHPGPATATVYAIQSDADFGNPVSVEVNIVASAE